MVIVGIDEVGRGCWAGPLTAAAVVLKRPIRGLKDSKKLTRQQREKLDIIIRKRALAIGLGWANIDYINQHGLTAAIRLAMQEALNQINLGYDQVIIDGNYNFLSDNPKARTIIKADNLVAAVSAASIIAKVARDNYMREIAAQYPHYGFESHVGYGTALHIARLKMHGPSDLHRKFYKPIQKFLLQLPA